MRPPAALASTALRHRMVLEKGSAATLLRPASLPDTTDHVMSDISSYLNRMAADAALLDHSCTWKLIATVNIRVMR